MFDEGHEIKTKKRHDDNLHYENRNDKNQQTGWTGNSERTRFSSHAQWTHSKYKYLQINTEYEMEQTLLKTEKNGLECITDKLLGIIY